MQRVMLSPGSVTLTPKQKRLSVGFGTNTAVQIHRTATPPNMTRRSVATPCFSTTDNPENDASSSRKKSLHEALLMRLLSTPSDEPLFQRSNSPEQAESQRTADDSFDSCLSGTSSFTEMDLLGASVDAMRCTTPPMAPAAALPNRHMQQIMRDFNSPSATARLRAVRALNSVSKRNAYGNFDVSYAEQDIITAEERIEQEKRTIQDVLRGVVVYVEVRSGTDNRSDGIKEHIASLGAKVNERLLKDTTHVIFKDGLLSTYQKAKRMNIPVVSILWIEACKRHTCLMNPNDFKISNLERYENPELFKRIRREKSMQPGAVETGRAKKGKSAAKTATTTVLSPPSKLPVLHRISKDDRLERILNDFEADNQIACSNDGPIDEYDQLLQAAPLRMLERFRSTPTPMAREGNESPLPIPPSDEEMPDGIEKRVLCRELFNNNSASKPKDASSPMPKATSRARRKTILVPARMADVEEESDPANAQSERPDTPNQTPARGRRKVSVGSNVSSIVAEKGNEVVGASPAVKTTRTIRTRRSTMIANADKENMSPASASMNISRHVAKAAAQRNTICTPKDMEVSNITLQSATINELPGEMTEMNSKGSTMNISTSWDNVRPEATVPKASRRRTTFCSAVEKGSDETPPAWKDTGRSAAVSSSVHGRRRTIFTPGSSTPIESLEVGETPSSHAAHGDGSSIINRPNPSSSSTPKATHTPAGSRRKTLLQQYEDSLTFSSTRAPDRRRRTVFDITMDIMDHRLSEINRQAAAAKEQSSEATSAKEPAVQPTEALLKSPPPAQTSLDEYYRKATRTCEKPAQIPRDTTEADAAPKKRRLFNIQPAQENVPATGRQTPPVTAKPTPKRRSLAPPVTTVDHASKKRRTTALFQPPAEPLRSQEHTKKDLFPVGRGLPTMATQCPTGQLQRTQQQYPRQYLATTNLHTEQNEFVKEVTGFLGGFIVEDNVSDHTTHLVTLESRRTVNLLRALIRGLWIIRYDWIVDSHRAGRWLPEERFELREFSPAVQINRSERQAFGSRYSNELFADYGPFWISPRCPVPVGQLRELVLLCRGKVTGNRAEAKFLVVEPNETGADDRADGQISVVAVWLLDSIAINKVKKLSRKYRLG